MQSRRNIIPYVLPACTAVIVALALLFVDRVSSRHAFVFPPLSVLRDVCSHALAAVIGATPERALVSGVLFGGTSEFSSYWKQVFAATGTTHIVAVSGANIAYIAALVSWLFERTALSYVARTLAVLAVVLAYTLMVGAPASAVRAVIMCVYAYVAALIGRFHAPMHALCVSVLVMILYRPSIVFDVGFQLSAAATLGLIITGSSDERTTVQRAAQQTIAAVLFTTPIAVFHFGTFSAITLLTNIVAAPFVPFLTVVGFFVTGLALFAPTFATLAAPLITTPAHALLAVLSYAAQMPVSFVHVASSPMVAFAWGCALVVLCVIWARRSCAILVP